MCDADPATINTDVEFLAADLGINALRNTNNADVVVLLAQHPSYGAFGCARDIGVANNWAYCIVREDAPASRFTFVHEIAHLIGARHDDDPNTTPAPYGHGYVLPDGSRTIMGVLLSGNQRLQYWSNPNRFFNGSPMGTSGWNDNARLLNERTELVADFRDSYTAAISGPFQLSVGQGGTWNVAVQGNCGGATFSYRWFLKSADPASPNQWIGPLSFSTTYSTSMRDFDKYLSLRADVSTSNGGSFSAYYFVSCTDCSGGSGGPLARNSQNDEQIGQISTPPHEVYSDFLFQNAPNPCSNASDIRFVLSEAKHIRLSVYDALGKEVLRLLDELRGVGQHNATINANTLAPGIYSYRLHTPQETLSKQLLVIK
jgi:hypothetical protein